MSTRRSLLRSIAAAAIPSAGASFMTSALFGLQISSPIVVFLATLSLLPSKPLSPPSPSPITPVVVQSRVPRKSLILVLLSLAALSFLVDGLAYVAYAVFNGVWRSGTGVVLAALLGLIAYVALAVLGAYKDVNNIEVWSRKRVKSAIFVALVLDFAQVVLLVLSVKTHDSSRICDTTKLSECIPDTVRFLTPLLRVIILLPLLFVLFYPQVAYVPAESQPDIPETETAPLVDQSGVLLQQGDNEPVSGGESSKYGTFTHGQPGSDPVPIFNQSESWLSIFRRLIPYISPSKGLLSLITLLHVLTRVIMPLIPLCLGAALNAFLATSSAPIPTPFGTSPYPYILLFVFLQFLVSTGGIPNLTRALVSRLGAAADDILSSHHTDHVLGLALSSTKVVTLDGPQTCTAVATLLHAVSAFAAAIDDVLIGAIVLGVLFGWEFGLAVLIALVIYGYLVSLTARPSILSVYPPSVSTLVFVQGLLASSALLLGSLYIAKGVTEGLWSAGSWVAWVWYWGVLFLPLAWIPSLQAASQEVRSIFRTLDDPVGVVYGQNSIDGTGGVKVKFDDVSVTCPYTDMQESSSILTGVSFVLPASSVTAVVDVSGSPKSSVLKTLFRLYDVDSGSIQLNGVPIHTLSLASLHSVMAAVPDVDSETRAKAVSRALAKEAKVVLVEGPLEPAFIGRRTVVWEVGTSGLGGVDSVDQILVLKNGQLVESGPFKELLQTGGVFASLWAEHVGPSAPAPGTSSVTASGAVEGYDASTIDDQPIDGQTSEATAVEHFTSAESPRAVTASIRATSVRAPSIKASIKADSVAPSVPAKDVPSTVSFPSAPEEPVSVIFPTSPNVATVNAISGSPAPAPIAFPKTDDARSIDSGSQAHVRLPTSVTFDTTATPPRVSTPEPAGASASSPGSDSEGKRRRISSQNFQRLARRISISAPKKGAVIPNIPGIAGIAGVLRRDTSLKTSDKGNGENSARGSIDAAGGSSSAPETARNSGEIAAERTERDKEREEKKRKRKSFMGVVSGKRGESSPVATPPAADTEPQGPSGGNA